MLVYVIQQDLFNFNNQKYKSNGESLNVTKGKDHHNNTISYDHACTSVLSVSCSNS